MGVGVRVGRGVAMAPVLRRVAVGVGISPELGSVATELGGVETEAGRVAVGRFGSDGRVGVGLPLDVAGVGVGGFGVREGLSLAGGGVEVGGCGVGLAGTAGGGVLLSRGVAVNLGCAGRMGVGFDEPPWPPGWPGWFCCPRMISTT